MSKVIDDVCKKIVEIGRLLAQNRLVEGSWGNISARAGKKNTLVAITPSGRAYESLSYKDISLVGLDGQAHKSRLNPSSELPLHLAIYKARPDVRAIVHTHSVFASAFSVAGLSIPPLVEDMAQVVGGGIAVSDYALPGTDVLAANAVAALGVKNAVLLANHGLAACGRNLAEALTVANIVEKSAKIAFLARQLNPELQGLSAVDTKTLHDFYRQKYSKQQLVEE